jgi:hypothetical protein
MQDNACRARVCPTKVRQSQEFRGRAVIASS